MKTRFIILLTAGLLVLGTGLSWAAPKAVIPDPRYEFSPTAEGQMLSHEFTVKNEGDTELNILAVRTP